MMFMRCGQKWTHELIQISDGSKKTANHPNSKRNNMAQQTPDPKLIESMAMRYRHDFGLLEETHKEAIRTTMKQLWEEVVGLGFYKDEKFGNSEHLAQQSEVEWLFEELNRIIRIEDESKHSVWLSIFLQQDEALKKAKAMEKENMIGLLKWTNKIASETPMRLETDLDDIVEQYYNEKIESYE